MGHGVGIAVGQQQIVRQAQHQREEGAYGDDGIQQLLPRGLFTFFQLHQLLAGQLGGAFGVFHQLGPSRCLIGGRGTNLFEQIDRSYCKVIEKDRKRLGKADTFSTSYLNTEKKNCPTVILNSIFIFNLFFQ